MVLGRIRDLRGRRFGRLVVPGDAQPEGLCHGNAVWPCVCQCGARVLVRSNKLVSGSTVSCGCYRRDPAVRRAARLRLSPERRHELALIGRDAAAAINLRRHVEALARRKAP